jgi:hypothetical protein
VQGRISAVVQHGAGAGEGGRWAARRGEVDGGRRRGGDWVRVGGGGWVGAAVEDVGTPRTS